jgi:hypothetical protein
VRASDCGHFKQRAGVEDVDYALASGGFPAERMQYRPGLLDGFLASTGLAHTFL